MVHDRPICVTIQHASQRLSIRAARAVLAHIDPLLIQVLGPTSLRVRPADLLETPMRSWRQGVEHRAQGAGLLDLPSLYRLRHLASQGAADDEPWFYWTHVPDWMIRAAALRYDRADRIIARLHC